MSTKARKTTGKSSTKDLIKKVHKDSGIIGREQELSRLALALRSERNILIEGPVGVGKTALASALAKASGLKVFRVDGDSRFTEQKLTGWFDPALVLKKGYSAKTFVPGPLLEAMKAGAVLFINELNRMPEIVQNVLLPALDEGLIHIPQLGEVKAKPGFLVIATQNPREFVATSHLSEALMDRMEWIQLDYQSFEEEKKIAAQASGFSEDPFLNWAVGLVRITRQHPKIKRGASIRAAIAILKLLKESESANEESFWNAVRLALPTRIELHSGETEGSFEQQIELIIRELFDDLKKKPQSHQQTLSH